MLLGGYKIRKILRSRLSQRFAGIAPPIAVEIGMGIGAAVVAVALRYLFARVIGDTAPYIFVSAAIAVSAFLAGWRSGLISLIAGDALTLLTVIGPPGSFYIDDAHRRSGFIAATMAQLILLLIIALYQREIDRGARENARNAWRCWTML